MASYLFKAPLNIDIHLDGEDARQYYEFSPSPDRKEKALVFEDGESVRGKAIIRPKDGRKIEHSGIKVQMIGTIELQSERGTTNDFLSLVQELSASGELQSVQEYDFEFKKVEKPYESFFGSIVKLRYFIRVTVSRRLDIVREKNIWVYHYSEPPENNPAIRMDVGIEDCLHIEFEYTKSKYSLKDVVIGKIYFLLVRLNIKHMEISIVRRETTGVPPNQFNESETITRFELMDGTPNKGEVVPLRLFLGGFDLTPTFRDINKKFSVRYYLSLILVDQDQRRYFKQTEIILWRQEEVGIGK